MFKKVFLVFVLSIILMLNSIIALANTTPITEEELTSVFNELAEFSQGSYLFEMDTENKKIRVTSDDETYDLIYDLTNNPKFSYVLDIEKGISYDEFNKKTGLMLSPMLGYIAVAKTQGVDFEDSGSYISLMLLSMAFSGTTSSDKQYMFVDDDTTVESNYIVIKESEFGDHVLEYVQDMYGEKREFRDNEDAFDTFIFTSELKDLTEDSCKIVTTIEVDMDADFSQLIEYGEKMQEAFLNQDITEENADYVIRLKVGQKCIVIVDDEIVGHEVGGSDCFEYDDDTHTLTATNKGKANGYIYVGDSETKKSIYIIVEENLTGEELETITLRIEDKETNAEEDTNKPDNTIASTTIPKTGINSLIFILSIIVSVIGITVIAKNIKYKDI